MVVLAYSFVTCGGIGYIPVCPGTCASAIAALLWWYSLQILQWQWVLYMLIISFWSGVWVSNYSIRQHSDGVVDPSWIVIDEYVGMGVALWCLHVITAYYNCRITILYVASVFALFRLFDITKLWPCHYGEMLAGGLGIMTDDCIAGVQAGVIAGLFFVFCR